MSYALPQPLKLPFWGGERTILKRDAMYPFPLADEILVEPMEIKNGYLTVPKGPGLGIEIDECVAAKYPFIKGPWSFFRIDSPPETVTVTGDHSVKWIAGTP